MADKINIDTQLLEDLSSQIMQVKASLTALRGDVSSSLAEVRRVASGQTATIRKLSGVYNNLENVAEHANKLSKAVGQSARLWKEKEDKLAGKGKTGRLIDLISADAIPGLIPPQRFEDVRKELNYPEDTSKWTEEMSKSFYRKLYGFDTFTSLFPVILPTGLVTVISPGEIVHNTYDYTDTLNASSSFTNGKLVRTVQYNNGSYSQTEMKVGFDKLGWDGKLHYTDKDGNIHERKLKPNIDLKKEIKGKESERYGTIVQFGADASTESDLYHKENQWEAGWGDAKVKANINRAEAHAGVHAGLYATKVDDNGNTSYHLEPGVDAKFGASFSAFNAEGEGKIGGENLNIHGKTSASILKAGGEAEAQLGFVDGKIAARAEGKAELTLAEVKGSVGVNVAGVEANVSASASVGVGFHASAGYYDGVITCDIGASLGVGGSLSMELDVGGAVDNVVAVAGKVRDGAAKAAGLVIDSAVDVGKNIAQGASKFLNWFS